MSLLQPPLSTLNYLPLNYLPLSPPITTGYPLIDTPKTFTSSRHTSQHRGHQYRHKTSKLRKMRFKWNCQSHWILPGRPTAKRANLLASLPYDPKFTIPILQIAVYQSIFLPCFFLRVNTLKFPELKFRAIYDGHWRTASHLENVISLPEEYLEDGDCMSIVDETVLEQHIAWRS